MLNKLIKDLSILKKFLFINLLIFSIISLITIFYLNTIQPNLINKKTSNHIQIINNTTEHLNACVALRAPEQRFSDIYCKSESIDNIKSSP